MASDYVAASRTPPVGPRWSCSPCNQFMCWFIRTMVVARKDRFGWHELACACRGQYGAAVTLQIRPCTVQSGPTYFNACELLLDLRYDPLLLIQRWNRYFNCLNLFEIEARPADAMHDPA